uniref:peroxidase n=2 Tax=Strongyloides stercoralis TaxID=6248 RepID=A0A0K0EPD5_STRER
MLVEKIILLLFFLILNFVFVKNERQSDNMFFINHTPKQCDDKNVFCSIWSSLGECLKSPKYMFLNCPKSCSICDVNSNKQNDIFNKSGCSFIKTSQHSTEAELSDNIFLSFLSQRQCGVETVVKDCSNSMCYHKFFRTLDGSCNNLKHPTWGAGKTRYLRLLPPLYEDNISIPVGTRNIFRPSPRSITRYLLNHDKNVFSNFNQLAMQWGQFISHDILFNGRSDFCSCQTFSNQNCMNVNVAKDDVSKLKKKVLCIPITRSIPVCRNTSFLTPREQMNLNSGYLDGSTIYGSTTVNMNQLRSNHLLKFEANLFGKEFAPESLTKLGESMKLGDGRGTIFVGIASLHTIFLRYHNIIARELKIINSHWTNDRIFQETRKIIGSVIQSISYNEFLPALIGEENLKQLMPRYSKYNDNISPAISNEFSAAAYRLHGMIVSNYPFINNNYQVIGNIKFVQGTNTFTHVLQKGISQLFRGMIATPLRKPQRLNSQVTEELFNGHADLSTINIQRGRDHGLRSYNDYRKFCGLDIVDDFINWKDVSDINIKIRAKELYLKPENIELYVGGLLEEPIPGGIVGPTFACLITEQFQRLRDGDRFFYQNKDIYTEHQINEISKISIASVICSTEPEINKIPLNAFNADKGERAVACSMIPTLNLNHWKSNN